MHTDTLETMVLLIETDIGHTHKNTNKALGPYLQRNN